MAEGVVLPPNLVLPLAAGPEPGVRYFDFPGCHRNHLVGALRTTTALYAWLVRLRGAPRRHRKLAQVPSDLAKFLTAAMSMPSDAPRHPELMTREAFRRVGFEKCSHRSEAARQKAARKKISRQGRKPEPTPNTHGSSSPRGVDGTRRVRGAGKAARHTPARKPDTVPAPEPISPSEGA